MVELDEVLVDMVLGKVLGLDWVLVEFYVKFWFLIKEDFLEIIMLEVVSNYFF